MRNFHKAVKLTNLVQSVNAGRETSMQAEDVVLNNGSQWQKVKERCKILPDFSVAILAKAFIVEAIDLSNLLRLMVSTQNGDTVGVPNFHDD